MQKPARPVQFAQLDAERLREPSPVADQFARAGDPGLQFEQAARRVGELAGPRQFVGAVACRRRTQRARFRLAGLAGVLVQHREEIVGGRGRGVEAELFGSRCGCGDRVAERGQRPHAGAGRGENADPQQFDAKAHRFGGLSEALDMPKASLGEARRIRIGEQAQRPSAGARAGA